MAEQDIAAMASHMLTLDLVITVDTMVAHLAGALALRSASDWQQILSLSPGHRTHSIGCRAS
jgi:hypothetical protein